MKYLPLVLCLCAACSSPTAPSPAPVAVIPPVVVVPPVVTPPVTPTRNPLLDDPRFDASFYRMFVHGTLEYAFQPLRRQTQPPRIYLKTVDEAGRPMDALTLDQTTAALINTAGSLTGVFGLAGLEQGTQTREGQAGWITVKWMADATGYCGYGAFAGGLITLAPRTPGCRCAGGPAVALATVKHELGHVLGFYHSDNRNDLMYKQLTVCDQNPSAREQFAARVAYSMPNGSLDP